MFALIRQFASLDDDKPPPPPWKGPDGKKGGPWGGWSDDEKTVWCSAHTDRVGKAPYDRHCPVVASV